MRDLTIGPVGSAVCLRMIRGDDAPLMLRGVEYAVTLHRILPGMDPSPAGDGSPAAPEPSAVLSLTGRSHVSLVEADQGRAVGVPAAAAAAAELVRHMERILACGVEEGVDFQSAREGVRAGYVYFYV